MICIPEESDALKGSGHGSDIDELREVRNVKLAFDTSSEASAMVSATIAASTWRGDFFRETKDRRLAMLRRDLGEKEPVAEFVRSLRAPENTGVVGVFGEADSELHSEGQQLKYPMWDTIYPAPSSPRILAAFSLIVIGSGEVEIALNLRFGECGIIGYLPICLSKPW
jgi:hypothetical protein